MHTIRRRQSGGRGMVLRLLLPLVVLVGACDFLDPTDVENPRTTSEDLARTENPVQALLPGARAQFARLTSSLSVVSEVVSDNFSIHGTGLFKEWDSPRSITPSVANSTGTATGVYWNAQELKALASFILEDIAPGDPSAPAEALAEARYYRGMAFLVLGENFSAAPIEADGQALPSSELLALAVQDLEQATAFGPQVHAALARAHRLRGDATAAMSAAQAALNADPALDFEREFDASSIENVPYAFLVSRALQEMQPLPRLDFLDPKFLARTDGIAIAKAEEMHLIMAEAVLAGGDVAGAATHLQNAILVAEGRATTSFDDEDPRLNADLSIRPRDASIVVRADASSPFRAGLVLTRPGVVLQHPVTGTSLDADSVGALATEDELWHALHLARQEMLFLEGRRMADLGIRLPMMLREIDSNPSIAPGSAGTEVVVPAYIPADDEMDLFTPASPYDASGTLVTNEVTILFDMNRVLADNGVTPF